MKKTLIAILFVTLFIGMLCVSSGAEPSNDIKPQTLYRNRWALAAITGGVLVEDYSYNKRIDKLDIFTDFEITGTVLYWENILYGEDFYIGSWGRHSLDAGDRVTISAKILFRPMNDTIEIGEEFWFSTAFMHMFHVGECLGINVKAKLLEDN